MLEDINYRQNGEILEETFDRNNAPCKRIIDQKYRLDFEEVYDKRKASFLLRRRIRKLEKLTLPFQFVEKLSFCLEYESPAKCLTIARLLEDHGFNTMIEERGIGLNNAEYWHVVTKDYMKDICSGKRIPSCRLVPIKR